ncbi:MAG: deoxyribonuclease IV [Methanomicrobiales archaeon]|nr:deoxyribonuclease IV [Methanomicrobiales archaeon]
MTPQKSVKVGVHVSIAGSICNAFSRAKELNCDCFQIFTKNPRGWQAKPLTDEDSRIFVKELESFGSDHVFAHVSYLPNLAGDKPDMYQKSVQGFCIELIRCEQLRIPFLVTHLGHAADDLLKGRKRVAQALNLALNKISGNCMILLENTAGEKHSVGSTFDDIADVIGQCQEPSRIGVCFDTCHGFAAGYDLRDDHSVGVVADMIEDTIGISHIRLIHLNDTKGDLGSGLDRHEHIGLGILGKEGIRAVLHEPGFSGIPLICETPVDDRRGDRENIYQVRQLAKS